MSVNKAYMVFIWHFSNTRKLYTEKLEVNTDIFLFTGLISYFDTFFDYFPISIQLLHVEFNTSFCLKDSFDISHEYMSHCQNSSKFLSIAYFMKTADVIMFFFLHMIGLIILVNGN